MTLTSYKIIGARRALLEHIRVGIVHKKIDNECVIFGVDVHPARLTRFTKGRESIPSPAGLIFLVMSQAVCYIILQNLSGTNSDKGFRVYGKLSAKRYHFYQTFQQRGVIIYPGFSQTNGTHGPCRAPEGEGACLFVF